MSLAILLNNFINIGKLFKLFRNGKKCFETFNPFIVKKRLRKVAKSIKSVS